MSDHGNAARAVMSLGVGWWRKGARGEVVLVWMEEA